MSITKENDKQTATPSTTTDASVSGPKAPEVKLPAGMQMISDGTLAEAVEWVPGLEIEGIMISRKTAKVKQGNKLEDRSMLIIDTGDKRVAVWEAAGLKDLFNIANPGGKVYIMHYDVQTFDDARNDMKLFYVGYDASSEYGN